VFRCLLLFSLLFSPLFGDPKGTLIVTYKTGEKGERLDRIRFWLIDEKQDQQMYPRKGSFVDDQSSLKRIVVIKDLKPGKYLLDFVIPNQDDLFEYVPQKEIVIGEDVITEIEQLIKPKYSSIQANTTPPNLIPFPKITLKNEEEEAVATGSQGELLAKNLIPGAYTLHFEEIPGYSTPIPIPISLNVNEHMGPYTGVYDPSNEEVEAVDLLKVQGGEAIVGDTSNTDPENQRLPRTFLISPFSIGKYEVTNREFAKWLNTANRKQTIMVDSKGRVLDKENRLLYKTKTADIYSQIQYYPKEQLFAPLDGKEDFPLFNVTWFGAVAYCDDNRCRLPTEAEWEKAAGMSLETPPKKYLYGFSRDRIDPSLANYHPTDQTIPFFQVLTTKVGTYNGHDWVTLPQGQKIMTQDAASPVGAYDMSGNVWEWVSDWYAQQYDPDTPNKDPQGPASGSMKVVKGGCYDSLASGVRVAERLGLPPDHADVYTGFRMAR
jgi:formylglycine-generating enzyme required for sulfatase activity